MLTSRHSQYSKIGKVMRHISALTDDIQKVPRDDEFQFKARAAALVTKWRDMLANDAQTGFSEPAEKGADEVEVAEVDVPLSNLTIQDDPAA